MAGFGLVAALAAIRANRALPTWFAFGAILGPVALLILHAAPPGRCRSCSTPTKGWLRICLWCGEPVTAIPVKALSDSPKRSGLASGRGVKRPDQATPLLQPQPAQTVAHESVRGPKSRVVESWPAPTVLPSRPAPPPRAEPRQVPAANEAPSAPMAQVVRFRDTAKPRPDGQRLRGGGDGTQPSSLTPVPDPVQGDSRMLTTAVYITGNTSLEAGRRYIIAVHGPRLRVMGPDDVDPSAVVLDRALAELDATAMDGRLVISGPGGRSGIVLVFMSVAGTPERVADAILDAARAAGE
jgi:hypothetical protein